jgi:hypothetical protein
MPAMDKTGPFGAAPLGSGMGPCQQANSSIPSQGYGNGRGLGLRRGGGRGNGRGCWGGNRFGQASLTREEEVAMLEERISAMRARAKALQGKSVE